MGFPLPRKMTQSPPQAEDPLGLSNSHERVVMTAQEICDDVFATIPKLRAATKMGTAGKRWTKRTTKNNVSLYELSPGSSDDTNDDLDVAHALVAKTELRCHLNEVLNVLMNPQSADYETTMKSLWGKKFESGKVFFQQRRKFSFQRGKSKAGRSRHNANLPQDGLVAVHTMTIRPKTPVRFSAKRRAPQTLAFASCTLQYPTKDKAVHVMKTIPKGIHDQVIPGGSINDRRSALRGGLDHIAMGIDIQSTHGAYSALSHSTRIFLYTYASVVSPTDYTKPRTQHHKLLTSNDVAHQRKALMNSEARRTMDVLTKSLRQYETVIRRRRFGFQSFVDFSTVDTPAATTAMTPKHCHVCHKRFRFLYRRDAFCHMCGHVVCSDCSRMYEVEARVGQVRENRCCIECVVRVDNCVFDDEDLLAALGPAVVDADATTWRDDYPSLSEILGDDSAGQPSFLTIEDLSQSLPSPGPLQPTAQLQRLVSLVCPSQVSTISTLQASEIIQQVDAHVRASVQNARSQFSLDKCDVYGRAHDYAFTFRGDADTPLAPKPIPAKEAQRLQHIVQSGVLTPTYDRTALDMLARLAATHLKCSIGYVSVIDKYQQHVVGAYNYLELASDLPRDETLCMHNVYAEKPMVLKNPRRDQRFAQLPVVKDHGLQFYAGFPIRAPDGTVVASLCTADTTPHANITTKDYATMKVLADLASELLVRRQV